MAGGGGPGAARLEADSGFLRLRQPGPGPHGGPVSRDGHGGTVRAAGKGRGVRRAAAANAHASLGVNESLSHKALIFGFNIDNFVRLFVLYHAHTPHSTFIH